MLWGSIDIKHHHEKVLKRIEQDHLSQEALAYLAWILRRLKKHPTNLFISNGEERRSIGGWPGSTPRSESLVFGKKDPQRDSFGLLYFRVPQSLEFEPHNREFLPLWKANAYDRSLHGWFLREPPPLSWKEGKKVMARLMRYINKER